MNFKRYGLCFFIIALTLLLISSVSATEINDNSIDDLSVSDVSIEKINSAVVNDEINEVNGDKIEVMGVIPKAPEIVDPKDGGSIEVSDDSYRIDGEEVFEHQDELKKALSDFIIGYYDDDAENPGYEYLRYVRDYLFEAEYNDFDYDFALGAYEALFKTGFFNLSMACSTIRNGNFYGRNFDWIYCDLADFIIKSPATKDRHEVIGVASSLPTLSQDFVLSGEYSPFYKILPFQLVDGINDAGLVCCINVVPTGDKEGSTIITPNGNSEVEICSLILPRFILDNFDNAREAVEYIRDHVSIYQPTVIELHSLIADENETYLLEFFDGKVHITNMTGTNRSFMTNFYLTDVVFNEDGSVYTPETKTATENPVSTNNITKHGHGLERYNLINERFNGLQTESDMRALLEDLTYSHICDNTTSPFWYSEYAHNLGIVDITLDTMNISELTPLIKAAKDKWDERSRVFGDYGWGVGYTGHACVYDIEKRQFSIRVQEDKDEYVFTLSSTPKVITIKPILKDTYFGENIVGSIDSHLNGVISAIIDGAIYSGNVVNGKFVLLGTDKLSAKTYDNVYFTFVADDNSTAGHTTIPVTIKKKAIDINNSSNEIVSEGIPMQHTANPLLVLVISLFAVSLGSIKRKF